jgi:transposase
MQIRSVGIDLGKTTFHLVALGASGKVLVKKKFTQKQLLAFTVNMQSSLIGLEACSGAHFLGRALKQQGHDVRLIAAQFVKPFVKSNKNDFVDAEAIAEAVERKNMRFVPIKTDHQLDLQAIHRVRDRLVSRRTAVINQIRAFLLERGMVFAQKPAKLRAAMADVLENAENALTPMMRSMIGILWDEWKTVEQQIEELPATQDAAAFDRSQASVPSWRRPSLPPLATEQRSARDETLRRGSDWCRGSTRPEARPSCWVSASEATSTCARCSSTEHALQRCA